MLLLNARKLTLLEISTYPILIRYCYNIIRNPKTFLQHKKKVCTGKHKSLLHIPDVDSEEEEQKSE